MKIMVFLFICGLNIFFFFFVKAGYDDVLSLIGIGLGGEVDEGREVAVFF